MSNKDLYQKICKEMPGVPLFMQPWWLDTVCQKWDVAIAKKGEQTVGVWAYPIEKKVSVSLLRNPMLTPYLGPHVFFPKDIKESNLDSFEHETVTELMKQVPDADVWHLALKPGMKQAGLFKNKKLRPLVQQTFLLDLAESEDALLGNMKETTRRNIRQADKDITVSNSPESVKELYKFQKATLTNKGAAPAYTAAYLQKIMDACLAHDAAKLWVAKKDGETQAIVWQVWDDNSSYYFMGGQNQESSSSKAMSLLLWCAIKEAKKKGHKTFDLEGSMDEGVERFFRSFGGQRALYIVLHKNDSLLWKLKKMIFK